jgi:phosphoribosylformimino-5-aminoimidazole carboxamide ribotide isomerase
MIAIPSLKLPAGNSTPRAVGGDQMRRSVALVARELAARGFSRLHVAQSGTSSSESSLTVLEDLLRDTAARVQVGGATAVSDIEQLLRVGAELVVVGDRGIEEPEWLADVADLYPDAIGAATDVRDRRVVRRGWVRTLPVDILDLVDELNAVPLHELLVNLRPLDDAVRFGELALLEDVAERSRCPVLVAGGISTIADLRALEHRGIAGALIEAEKLLDGTFDAREVAQEFDS